MNIPQNEVPDVVRPFRVMKILKQKLTINVSSVDWIIGNGKVWRSSSTTINAQIFG